MKSNPGQGVASDLDRPPIHVAIIMDGNGRWAKKRLMNRIKGHEQGSGAVRAVVTAAREIGVRFLTLYAFSTENWERPETEVSALMSLLKKFIVTERGDLVKNGIRLNIIGQRHRLPPEVLRELDTAIDMTRNTGVMTLTLALSYGSRPELVQAMQAIASGVQTGAIRPESLTEAMVSEYLYTGSMPDPDLIIRTGGEYRLSNFLLWQAAYSELYFTDTLWPDFTKEEFVHILKNYQNRERRFGKVSCSTSNGG